MFFLFFFILLYTYSIYFKIWNFCLKGGFYLINWSVRKYDFWPWGRGGEPISDFWLTREGGGVWTPIFGWHNMWTAPNGWAVRTDNFQLILPCAWVRQGDLSLPDSASELCTRNTTRFLCSGTASNSGILTLWCIVPQVNFLTYCWITTQ